MNNILKINILTLNVLLALFVCRIPITLFASQVDAVNNQNISHKLSMIASGSFLTMKKIPVTGIYVCAHEIEDLVELQNNLFQDGSIIEYRLALTLKEAVAHALIYELYRSELSRIDIDKVPLPASVPFNKSDLVRLWNLNMLTEKQLLKNKVIVNGDQFVFNSEPVLIKALIKGDGIDVMTKSSRQKYKELMRTSRIYGMLKTNISNDELIAQSVSLVEILNSLNFIVNLYKEQNLPSDHREFRYVLDKKIENIQNHKLSDGTSLSSSKILSGFVKYCSRSYDDYCMRQAMLLGPYIANTDSLPLSVQKHLDKRKFDIQKQKTN